MPLDEADEKAHMEELKKYGIASEDSLVTTSKGNFYPLLRQKIIKSWVEFLRFSRMIRPSMVGILLEVKERVDQGGTFL